MKSAEHLVAQMETLTQIERDRATFEYWQTPAGETELHIRDLCRIADDLTDDVEHGDGAKIVRLNFQMVREAVQKINDIINDMTPFVVASE